MSMSAILEMEGVLKGAIIQEEVISVLVVLVIHFNQTTVAVLVSDDLFNFNLLEAEYS